MDIRGSSNEPGSPLVAAWVFWLWWVLASAVGWAVGGPMGVALGSSGDIILSGYLGVAVGGIVVGVLQWLGLRRQVEGAGSWMLAGIVAAAVIGVVVFGVGVFSPDVAWVVGAGAFGTVIGVPQWLVLRRQVARAGWWVVASTAGWVGGGLMTGVLGGIVGGAAASWAVLGAVYGAISGSVLVWLLRQRLPGSDLVG